MTPNQSAMINITDTHRNENRRILIEKLNSIPDYKKDESWYEAVLLLLYYIDDHEIEKAFWGRGE